MGDLSLVNSKKCTHSCSTEDAITVLTRVTTEDAITVLNRVTTEDAITVLTLVTTEDAITVLTRVTTEDAINVLTRVRTEDAIEIFDETSKPVDVLLKDITVVSHVPGVVLMEIAAAQVPVPHSP